MSRIKLLPVEVYNQIAAGEVIERPASVVKELLENCCDANATQIHIDIDGGGINRIQVCDNGDGILKDDLTLAITTHATSKINKLQDLYLISTLGFRGEALASIASVAKVSIISKPDSQEYAYVLTYENTESQILPSSRVKGTTVEIRDLFYNAPVRREFLKTEKTEYQIIEALVKRFALSKPEIAISLSCNSKKIFSLPKAGIGEKNHIRLKKILGSTFVNEAIFIKAEHQGIHLEGFISNQNYQRSQNDKQYFYINRRMIKDKLIQHSINKAYESFIYPGRFPAYVLYLTIETTQIDVNVHPTKQEVRFKNPRLIHDLISSSILKVLSLQDSQTEKKHENTKPMSFASRADSKMDGDIFVPEHNFVESSLHKWSILNSRFALVFINNQALLIDMVKYIEINFFKKIESGILPLPTRNFLVPIRFSVNKKLKNKIQEYHSWFEQLGVVMDFISETHILIRAICNDLEEINFNSFFDKLVTINLKNQFDLAKLLIEAQSINLLLLSKEEQNNLLAKVYEHLEKSSLKTGFSITLNEELCCNLIRQNKSYV